MNSQWKLASREIALEMRSLSKEINMLKAKIYRGITLDCINLSDFPEDTYIFLEENERIKLFNKLEEKYDFLSKASQALDITGAELYFWKKGYSNKRKGKVKRYIPLNVLKTIYRDINADVNILQDNVSEIKANSRAGLIRNPSLPLQIKPETFALLGHFLSDGYGGEIGNACYISNSKEARENFISKLKSAFGDVEYSILEKHHRIIVAKIVPKILKRYFGIDDFRTGRVKFPEKIFNAPKPFLIELLKAIIIDESRIGDSGIHIEFSPKSCLNKVTKKLCKRLGYKLLNYKKAVIISPRSFPKIKEDMKDFIIPSKQEMFLRYFKRKNREWYNRYRGTTKEEILGLLSKRDYSIRELASKLNIKGGGVRDQIVGYNFKGRRIKGLLELGLVKVKRMRWHNTRIFCIKN